MMLIRLFIIFLLLIQNVYAENYEKITFDNHVLYRYDFNTRISDITLHKALDSSKLGLETVYTAAKRHNAKAAFNGGFFYYSHAASGVPVSLLIAPNIMFATKSTRSAIYKSHDGKIGFGEVKAEISINLPKNAKIYANSINNPVLEGIRIFTAGYWERSLTSSDFQEIIVEDGIVTSIHQNGNSLIPKNGFIISADKKSQKLLAKISKGQKIDFTLNLYKDGKKLKLEEIDWLLSGSDFLIKEKKIPSSMLEKSNRTAFHDEPHARTSICQLAEDKFAIVLADHNEALQAYDLKLRDIIKPLKEHGIARETVLNMKTAELLALYNQYAGYKEVASGVKLLELANYLKSIGCINAINLDGGGSTTLYVDGKVVNNPAGVENKMVAGKYLRGVGDMFIIKDRAK